MDPFIKSFFECVWFSVLLNLAYAFDEEFEKKWNSMHKRTILAPGTIVTIFVALMIAATCISLLCFCLRRQRNIYNASPCVPPPLTPAAPVVTSGARTHAPLDSYPLVSGATLSPATPSPQQTYYPQPTAPYLQGGPHMGNDAAPLIQPPAAVLPSPSAPREPLPYERPPPYANQSEESYVMKS
ncbi:uncharacterized protein LOC119404997 [Rhipicephalus sanguineus]|uniref:uncharacterized protein LOC119404997 n=1 Tax=Rhipicephalus sanguineus TaxID=34632 RepID=UPI0020C1D2E3|nr:uncharacterized protein LOC119404997 [Rhipicephalus sanguineus]